jgi:hypothetical protein
LIIKTTNQEFMGLETNKQNVWGASVENPSFVDPFLCGKPPRISKALSKAFWILSDPFPGKIIHFHRFP